MDRVRPTPPSARSLRPARGIPRSRASLGHRLTPAPATVRRWLLTLALAGLTAALTGRIVSSAEATRRAWGETRPVWVTTGSLPAGASLRGAVRAARWPSALVPAAAVADPDELRVGPSGLDGGVVVTAAATTRRSASGGGHRIAVPVGTARLSLRPGDHVDVWATVDAALTSALAGNDRRPDTGRAGPTTIRSPPVPLSSPAMPGRWWWR